MYSWGPIRLIRFQLTLIKAPLENRKVLRLRRPKNDPSVKEYAGIVPS